MKSTLRPWRFGREVRLQSHEQFSVRINLRRFVQADVGGQAIQVLPDLTPAPIADQREAGMPMLDSIAVAHDLRDRVARPTNHRRLSSSGSDLARVGSQLTELPEPAI